MELLSVQNMNISIGAQGKIENGSFSVESGDVILLTGPNGCGKSTIIKIIVGDLFNYSDISYSADMILYKDEHDIMHSEREREAFRKHVCYVSQEDEFESDIVLDCFLMAINYDVKKNREKYIYDFVTGFDIQDCFGFEVSNQLNGKERRLARKLKLKSGDLSDKEYKAIKFLAMSIKQMSGGQRKLTNIMTNLIRYSFSDLLLLDEPLNNLDYNNVRQFSNVLTKIYKSKSDLGVIIVTHCRSIPIVSRVIEINVKEKKLTETGGYICNSCFGKIDEDGIYK